MTQPGTPETEVRAFVQAALPAGSALRGVLCRSTLCRFDPGEQTADGQELHAITYLTRPGHTMPTF